MGRCGNNRDIDHYHLEIPSDFDSRVYSHEIDPTAVTRMHSSLQSIESSDDEQHPPCIERKGNLSFDQDMLERYVLLCAQDPDGGLRDKPSKGKDFYHSCYNLSGLSISQHVLSRNGTKINRDSGIVQCEYDTHQLLYQSEQRNLLGATHPVYNIRVDRVKSVAKSFKKY